MLHHDLIDKNVILSNGNLNTRYKSLLLHHFGYKICCKAELFELLFPNASIPTCKVCGACCKHRLGTINFNQPHLSKFANVCSSSCRRLLAGMSLSNRLSTDVELKNRRTKAFSKTMKGSITARNLSIKAAKTKSITEIDGDTIALIQVKKTRATKEANGTIIPLTKLSNFQKYRRAVHKLTAKQPLTLLPHYNLRGHYNNNGYHLDHIVSIFDGFRLGIPQHVIANIVNLRFIPAVQNTSKSGKSDMAICELFRRYHDTTL